jgi:hypothetical protein
MLDSVGTLISGAYSRIGKTLAGELRKAREAARNEAHLATLGDRPFAGCCPCMPERPKDDRTARTNPPVGTRNESSGLRA